MKTFTTGHAALYPNEHAKLSLRPTVPKKCRGIHDLIAHVGEQNILIDPLLHVLRNAQINRHGVTTLSFETTQITPTEIYQRESKKVGLVLWIPAELLPPELSHLGFPRPVGVPAPPDQILGSQGKHNVATNPAPEPESHAPDSAGSQEKPAPKNRAAPRRRKRPQ